MPIDNSEILYFAYGSNLDPERMKQRIGRIPTSQRARLPNYRLAFNKRASGDAGVYANIVQETDREDWGVIYRCTHEEMDVLDKCEGVASGHYRRHYVSVELEDGEIVNAITYVAGDAYICKEGSPSQEYLRHIVTGAQQHGLLEEYIKSIEDLASMDNSDG